jgi:simple sugar transport system permease protein
MSTVSASKAKRRFSLSQIGQAFLSANPLTLTFFAVLLGLTFGALVIIFTTPVVLRSWGDIFNHWDGIFHAIKVTFDNVMAAYRAIFTGSIFDPPQFWHSLTTWSQWPATLTPLSETLTYATPLIIVSIAVGIGFQTGVFNIGANGQAIVGAIAGTAAGSLVHMPTALHVPFTLVAGFLGGALAGAIPGLLKAYTGASEVIVTLMLNYVCADFLLYVTLSTALQQPNQQNDISRVMDPSAQLAPIFGANSGLRVNWGLMVAILVVVFAVWFLERSTLGFDFRVVGANPAAGRTAGINAKSVYVWVFVLTGGIAGLAAATQVAGVNHYIDGGFYAGTAGIGFTAITVALLGRNRPIGIVWGALLFAALGVGGRNMQAATGIPLDLATVIQGSIVLFVATPALVREFFHLQGTTERTLQLAAKGWSA